jgi:hypothetical protein
MVESVKTVNCLSTLPRLSALSKAVGINWSSPRRMITLLKSAPKIFPVPILHFMFTRPYDSSKLKREINSGHIFSQNVEGDLKKKGRGFMMRKRTAFSLLLIAILSLTLVFTDVSVFAQSSPPSGGRPLENLDEQKPSENGAGKIAPHLRRKIEEIKEHGITRESFSAKRASEFSDSLVRVNEQGDIHCYVYVVGTIAEAMPILESLGATIEISNQELGVIQAWIPFERIEECAQLSFVKRIAAPGYGINRLGSKTTEGDSVLRASNLRALGYDGTGVKVGVISNGVTNRNAAIALGDLPSNITILRAGSGDEGTAMLEIVYDLAPKAELGFCGASTELVMIDCVNRLSDEFGADIIVDDNGFYLEPYFEDGPVARAVAAVVNKGKIYVSAAGNDANGHYQGFYVNSGDGNNSHLISSGNNSFQIPYSMTVTLQWSNKFGQSADDYDLCKSTETPAACRPYNYVQNGNDKPLEYRNFTCPPDCNIQVRLVSGAAQTIKLYAPNTYFSNAQDRVLSNSIFGHPAVTGAIAAGAVAWDTPNTIESYSSRGPTQILYPTLETRMKPDVVATTDVSVTGVGGFGSPFPGTSASAPHVAGVAALLKGAYSSASDVVDALKNGAIDLGTAGDDTIYGAGRVDALASSQVLANSNRDSIGGYRGSPGWFLDRNKNGQWSGCSFDKCGGIWGPGALPAVGDWNGNGITDIGVFYSSSGRWDLDVSANFMWDGCSVDSCTYFGTNGDLPAVGDWNANGISKIGVFRPSTGRWYLDMNGNRQWDGCGVDACLGPFGMAGDLPVAGDWNGNGIDKIGVFRPSTGKWYLDLNNNRQWDGCSVDGCATFGTNGDLPVVGDWNGDGIAQIGVFRPSKAKFYLDLNGNRQWDPAVDGVVGYGINGDRPVAGKW